jgi:hypothetical protein
LVHEFDSRFKQRHSSALCGDLLGYDLRDSTQIEAAKAAGVFAMKCPDFLQSAVEILESLKYE